MLLLQYLPPIDSNPSQRSVSSSHVDHPPPFSSQPPSPRSSESSTESQSIPPPYTRSTNLNSLVSPVPGHRPSNTYADPYRFPSPPPPPPKRWVEHELNRKQRRIIRDAAGKIRIYDIGWKENLLDVIGGPGPSNSTGPDRSERGEGVSRRKGPGWGIWLERIVWGGRG